MLMFLLLGPMLEEKYGGKRLLIMIAITALVTGIINSIFCSTGLLGASGVVFMFVVLSSVTAFKEKEIPLTFIIVMILYIGQEVVNGVTSADNISQMGHIIGGFSGAVFGFGFRKN